MTKTIDDIDFELDHLRNRVDQVQEEIQEDQTPWYKAPSNIVATLAFVVSLGTTLVSYFHTQQQDVHSLRAELRGITQRLAALPRDNIELATKYKSEPPSLSTALGSLNTENVLLAQEADDILARLPSSQTISVDYLTVGQALMFSRKYDPAAVDLQKAIDVATGFDDEIAALRTVAALQMMKGNAGKSREYFQKAADIFSKYSGFDDFTQRTTSAQTQLVWAGSEASIREFGNAEQHLTRAMDFVNGMAPGQAADMWRMNLGIFRQQLAQAQADPRALSVLPGHPIPNGVAASGGMSLQ